PIAALRASSRARAIFSASTKSCAMGTGASIPRQLLGQGGRYSGMLRVPLEKVIKFAATGVAGMSGTFCDLENRLMPVLRGEVRTTWLGGIAAPSRRCLYMKASDSVT